MSDVSIDDEVEFVPIPMDRETRRRLERFADAIGAKPIYAAGGLLRDLLVDDEFYNAAATAARSRAH